MDTLIKILDWAKDANWGDMAVGVVLGIAGTTAYDYFLL